MDNQLAWAGICLLLAGCGRGSDAPLEDLGLKGWSVDRISISNLSSKKTIELDNYREMAFFLRQIRLCSPRGEENVTSEFDLRVYRKKPGVDLFSGKAGPPELFEDDLRMGRECIGPMVPASVVATRWYFENDSLYTFIKSKF